MANSWQGDERREHPRVPVDGDVRSKIQSTIEAPVVDVSLSGALLELSTSLPASTRYTLKLVLPGTTPLELTAEVVRSYVHGFDKNRVGQPSVRYRAAVRFVELGDERKRQLEEFLEKRRGENVSAHLSD